MRELRSPPSVILSVPPSVILSEAKDLYRAKPQRFFVAPLLRMTGSEETGTWGFSLR